MTRNEDLNKRFEPALAGRKTLGRFSPPGEQRKFSNLPVQDFRSEHEEIDAQDIPFQPIPAPDSDPLTSASLEQVPPAPAPDSSELHNDQGDSREVPFAAPHPPRQQ